MLFRAIIDSLTAVIEDPKSFFNWGESENTEHGENESATMRLKFPEAYKELITSDYELRLLRSTAFNLLLIAITVAVSSKLYVIAGISLVISVLVGAGWFRRLRRIKKRRKLLYAAALNMPNQ